MDFIEYQCEPCHYPSSDKINCSKQFSVEEHLTLPSSLPDIKQLMKVTAHPHIDHCKIIDNPWGKKMIIHGHIKQKLVYIADLSCQSIQDAHFKIPFCTFIELPHSFSSCHRHHHLCPRIMIEYLGARKTSPRDISKCVILLLWFSLTPPHTHPHPYPHSSCCSSHSHPESCHHFCAHTKPGSNCHSLAHRDCSACDDCQSVRARSLNTCPGKA